MEYTVGVIVCSDKGSIGERVDTSGIAIQEIVKKNGMKPKEYAIIPDDKETIKSTMQKMCDDNINLILTTGGTGFSKRDNTPEATMEIIEKNIPGIPEAMRNYSLQYSKNSMLSRSVAGICKNTIIVNLPGSQKAVTECLEYIIEPLQHGLGILLGSIEECGR